MPSAKASAFLLLVSAAMSTTKDRCNVSIPWTLDREQHPILRNLSDTQLEQILRCPAKLHGCSAKRMHCEGEYYITCSCRRSCDEIGNCCWGAASKPKRNQDLPRDMTRWSCEEIATGNGLALRVYVVSGCKRSYPMGPNRVPCEMPQASNDSFYRIPVTSQSKRITYRNGYCAYCNSDILNGTYWNTSVIMGPTSEDVVFDMPPFVAAEPVKYLPPCTQREEVRTCPNGTAPRLLQMCQNYLAPVLKRTQHARNHVIYKNAYCALCNGVNVRKLSCAPTEKLRMIPIDFGDTGGAPTPGRPWHGPNLAAIFRPVKKDKSCLARYEGKCYIKEAPRRRRPRLRHQDAPIDTNVSVADDSRNSRELQLGHHAERQDVVGNMIRSYLTVICLSLSLVCLALKALVFVTRKGLRAFSSQCTMCLSMTLFVTHLIFLLVNSFHVTAITCITAAIIIHYGFMSTFTWTTVLSYDIWRAVFVVSTTLSQKLVTYSAIGWGAPLLVISVSAILNWTTPNFALSPLYGEGASCFINSWWSHLVLFLLPMTVLLLTDIGFYVHTVLLIRKTQREANRFDSSGKEKRTQLLLFVKLALIMGTPWMLALVSAFVNSLAIDCINIVLIGFQGVYLFFGFRDYRLCFRMLPSGAKLTRLFNRCKTRQSSSNDLPPLTPGVLSVSGRDVSWEGHVRQ